MKDKRLKVFVIFVSAVVSLAVAGCIAPAGSAIGELRTESQTVERGDADAVTVEVNMGAGELNVAGGASSLMEAEFTYNVAESKPEVEYSDGRLTVNQPDSKPGLPDLFAMQGYRYEWDLRFDDAVPMEMSVDLGAGKADLNLGSLALSRLDVTTGAGETMLDLGGTATLSRLDVDTGAGATTVDLTGDWQKDLDAVIRGGVGRLTLRLPTSVGAIVDINTGIGDINAAGLRQDGDTFTNDAYGESAVTLHISIDAGIGEIDLESGG